MRKAKGAAPAAMEEHPGGGHISVSVQQSRYALDAVDAPASKEVCTEEPHHTTKSKAHIQLSSYSSKTSPSQLLSLIHI